MDDQTEPLVIGIGPASDPRPSLQLRIDAEHIREIAADLEAEQVFLGSPVYASSAAVMASVVLASTASGLGGVAAVIRAFASRHQHRRVVITNRDGDTIELSGLPASEMDRRLSEFLTIEKRKHDDIRHLYRFPGDDDDTPAIE